MNLGTAWETMRPKLLSCASFTSHRNWLQSRLTVTLIVGHKCPWSQSQGPYNCARVHGSVLKNSLTNVVKCVYLVRDGC
jgi:hypothetical protein